ncbi:hypothetical protein BJV78DRAFT_1156654 [Lactifluus subvellereus]|nr:hypothetical protein BJV78DRAFT_1156654 [Lactifluus subvellereus]
MTYLGDDLDADQPDPEGGVLVIPGRTPFLCVLGCGAGRFGQHHLSTKSGALAPRITHMTYAPRTENRQAAKRIPDKRMLNGRRNGEGNCRINGVAHEDTGRKESKKPLVSGVPQTSPLTKSDYGPGDSEPRVCKSSPNPSTEFAPTRSQA